MSETNEEKRARFLRLCNGWDHDTFRCLYGEFNDLRTLLGPDADLLTNKSVRDTINKHFGKIKDTEMGECKFKVGDRVRKVNGLPFTFTGQLVQTVVKIEPLGVNAKIWFEESESWAWKSELILDQLAGPIQSRTVKELVDGVYGRVSVSSFATPKGYVSIGLDRSHLNTASTKFETVHQPMNAQELRATIKTFSEIADWLEGK